MLLFSAVSETKKWQKAEAFIDLLQAERQDNRNCEVLLREASMRCSAATSESGKNHGFPRLISSGRMI